MSKTDAVDTSFWNQRFYFLDDRREKWGLVIFLTIYVPLFLIIFQPFGVNNYDPSHSIRFEFLLSAFGFGLVNGITIWIFEFGVAPLLFKQKTRFLFLIRTLLEFTFLATTMFLFYNFLGNFHDWNWSSYLGFIRDIHLSGIIPLSAVFLYFNYRKAQRAYEVLKTHQKSIRPEKEQVVLKSDNGKETVVLRLHNLLFIEAQDNYVAVYHLENDKVTKVLLRTKMKILEAQLADLSVVRCHRSFLVNIHAIEKITGNSHSLKLHFPKVTFFVPVSRTYASVLEKSLTVHPSN